MRRKLIGLLAVKGEKSSDVIKSQRDPTVLDVALVAVAPEKVRRLMEFNCEKYGGPQAVSVAARPPGVGVGLPSQYTNTYAPKRRRQCIVP